MVLPAQDTRSMALRGEAFDGTYVSGSSRNMKLLILPLEKGKGALRSRADGVSVRVSIQGTPPVSFADTLPCRQGRER